MDFCNLLVYQKAFALAMDVFHLSKSFPKEERYSLTDQIRRSTRAVCSALGEGYRKRQYQTHFLLKLSDSDAENTETQVWLDFALACSYVDSDQHLALSSRSQEIGRLLAYMMQHPEKYC